MIESVLPGLDPLTYPKAGERQLFDGWVRVVDGVAWPVDTREQATGKSVGPSDRGNQTHYEQGQTMRVLPFEQKRPEEIGS